MVLDRGAIVETRPHEELLRGAASTASFTICSSRTKPFRPERSREECCRFLGYLFLRALHATLRVRHVNAENLERHAALHPRVLAPAHPAVAALAMAHADDGDHLAVEGRRDRFARAASLRRGDCARLIDARRRGGASRDPARHRAGKNIAFTPDGPKGPSQVVKDGVIYVAKVSGLPIVPFAFAAKKKVAALVGSDGLPDAVHAALYLYGAPIFVPRDGDTEEWRADGCEKTMNELADEARERSW